jgi:hypothetical protein
MTEAEAKLEVNREATVGGKDLRRRLIGQR